VGTFVGSLPQNQPLWALATAPRSRLRPDEPEPGYGRTGRAMRGFTWPASWRMVYLSAFGMGANPALWPFARERRMHVPL